MNDPQLCTPNEIDSWLELARDVTHLFGPMPDLQAHIQRGIARGTAIITLRTGVVSGAMLLSGPGRPQYIRWLAVRPEHRGRGIGTALLHSAMRHWPQGDIGVVTFPARHSGGQAARHLYQQNGFISRGLTDPAPDGSARELFVLSRARS